MAPAIELILTTMLYMVLIAVPVIMIDRTILKWRARHSHVQIHPSPVGAHLVMSFEPEIDELEIEEKRLAKFDKLLKNCTTEAATRLWTVKKAEYVHTLKWKNLTEWAPGSSDSLTSPRVYNTDNARLLGVVRYDD